MNIKNKIILARIFAYVIDILLLYLILFVFSLFTILNFDIQLPLNEIVVLIYFIYFYATTGQTIGQKLFYIKVVDFKEGGIISLKQAVLSEIIWLIITIVNFIISFIGPDISEFSYLSQLANVVILISIVIDKNSRGIHDRIANTKIVDMAKPIVSDIKY